MFKFIFKLVNVVLMTGFLVTDSAKLVDNVTWSAIYPKSLERNGIETNAVSLSIRQKNKEGSP